MRHSEAEGRGMRGVAPVARRAEPGERREMIKKVCIVGDSGVGKNTIAGIVAPFERGLDRLVERIGAAVTKYGAEFQVGAQRLRLTILVWDVTGRRDFRRLWSRYYTGAEGFIVVADASRPSTLVSLPLWISAVRGVGGKSVPIVVVVNKTGVVPGGELAELRQQLTRALADPDIPIFLVDAVSSSKSVLKAPFRELARRIARREAVRDSGGLRGNLVKRLAGSPN